MKTKNIKTELLEYKRTRSIAKATEICDWLVSTLEAKADISERYGNSHPLDTIVSLELTLDQCCAILGATDAAFYESTCWLGQKKQDGASEEELDPIAKDISVLMTAGEAIKSTFGRAVSRWEKD